MLPRLKTQRLCLGPFHQHDALIVQTLAGEFDVARTTLNIPHPYPHGAAETWIASHLLAFLERKSLTLAIRLHDDQLIGAISLSIKEAHHHGELGYWIGKSFWGHGYCTEAARSVLQYGFESLCLQRMFAYHMSLNPASGRVMQKIGMKHEGRLRGHIFRFNQQHDIEIYGILRSEPIL